MKYSGFSSWGMAITIGILACCIANALARPQHISRERRSGISDQRLAEIETLLAIARMRERTRPFTKQVAHGLVDPNKIGRRRRRSLKSNYNLDNDLMFLLPELSRDNNADEDQQPQGPHRNVPNFDSRAQYDIAPEDDASAGSTDLESNLFSSPLFNQHVRNKQFRRLGQLDRSRR